MSDLENLKNATSRKDLAQILGYKLNRLTYIVYKIPDDQKYEKFSIPKSGGGTREICAPIGPLKTLQRRLANVLYACRDDIDRDSDRRPLSHGFRRKLSIITNARRHKRRRYVLTLDLQDFFPTFNFGRVRGFFLRNNDFELNDKVATLIAQIACFENGLPQGSPCSPIIADLIAHLLDVRLAQLAKRHGLTYSRYADDLTFSTSQQIFPSSIAAPVTPGSPEWTLGKELTKAIKRASFIVNPAKTRMQFRMSRQLVTGLTVNAKVNIRAEYYRWARAMCHRLFETGEYHRPVGAKSVPSPPNGQPAKSDPIKSLNPLEGILSHIHHVKDAVDDRDEQKKKKKENATAARELYARFLKYRYFVRLERPLIVCEGKTDSIYLKHAIRRLTDFHPQLGSSKEETFTSAVAFFNYTNQARRILNLNGGTGDLLHFFFINSDKQGYKHDIQSFKHRPLKHPVIVLIDNDSGAKKIFPIVRKNYSTEIDHKSSAPFFHLTDNLYLVKTPEKGSDGFSFIEDCFDSSLLQKELKGKKFNPHNDVDTDTEYGKWIFAKQVVQQNAATINFKGFAPLLERIVAVIDDYTPPPTVTV